MKWREVALSNSPWPRQSAFSLLPLTLFTVFFAPTDYWACHMVPLLLPGTFLVFTTSNEVVRSNLTGRCVQGWVKDKLKLCSSKHFKKRNTWKLLLAYKIKTKSWHMSVPGSKHQCFIEDIPLQKKTNTKRKTHKTKKQTNKKKTNKQAKNNLYANEALFSRGHSTFRNQ